MFPEVYVNTFGVGAPLAGLPVYAVLDLFVDIEHDRFWWWHGAALTASLLTALAALFVFLAARGFVQPLPAVLIALAFGLGSCAWPVSSEITKRDIPGSGGAAAGLRVPGCVPLVGSTDLGLGRGLRRPACRSRYGRSWARPRTTHCVRRRLGDRHRAR